MKKKMLILIPIILIIIIFLVLIFIPKKNEDLIIGVNYLPPEDKIYLDNGELSYFINPLVYPSSIKINKDGYENILAQNIKIKENEIIVKYNKGVAQYVYDSYLLLNREIYENNWKCLNIVGAKEYQEYMSDTISGIELIDEKTIKFQVINSDDLEFLTLPIVCGNLGQYSITKYEEYKTITLENSNKEKITIKKVKSDDKSVDMYITGNSEIIMSDEFLEKEIYPYYDYIILSNYTDVEKEVIKDVINGKVLKNNKGVGAVYYWCDATAQAYYITENLKEKFSNNDIEFRNDYGEDWYLLKKSAETSDKFIFYYEGNYYDKDILKSSNNELIKVEAKKISLYYKENAKNLINKYF